MIEINGDFSFVDSSAEEALRLSHEQLLKQRVSTFYECPEIDQLWQQSESRAAELSQNYETLVVLGIGGSSLGGRAVEQAMRAKALRSVVFIDNVDGFEIEQTLRALTDLSKTHWLIISKSGGTLETLALVDVVDQYLADADLSILDHATVIADDKESPLVMWADKHKVPRLEIPATVGGRFSVLTPVGLLPAAFMGLDLSELREGARQALKNVDSVLKLSAFSEKSFSEQRWITGLWFYCDRLQQFGRWFQQLWAESLAKKTDRNGGKAPQVSVPLPLVGTVDQHSVLQQFAEGHELKSAWFFRVEQSEVFGEALAEGHFTDRTQLKAKPIGRLLQAFAKSTRESLEQHGTTCLEIKLLELTERSLGELFMTAMLVVGTLGERLNIDAFNQPGVELSKTLVKKSL